MNLENYKMNYEDRKQYVYDKALELLKEDDDAFCEAVEELIGWNGFIDEECFSMNEIDDICYSMKPSELLEKMTSDFDSNDKYFYFSIYGLESTDSKCDIYRDNTTEDDVLDELIDEYCHVSLSGQLDEYVSILANEDFGIEEDWEGDEDMDEDDLPEETDEEFKERIDSI